MGSIPRQVILPNYSKIAPGLSRIYNTVSIAVKLFHLNNEFFLEIVLFNAVQITFLLAQWVESIPNEVKYHPLKGSTPGRTILWNYSKIASGLSRIYNTSFILPLILFPPIWNSTKVAQWLWPLPYFNSVMIRNLKSRKSYTLFSLYFS